MAFALLATATSCSDKPGSTLYLESKREPGQSEPPVKNVPGDILAAQKAFSNVALKVTPSVVNISTVSRKKIVNPLFEISPFFDDFFGAPQYRQNKSLGSGFILSEDGFIVTNDHVVRDAESIQVKLSNEKIYNARIIGSDPKTDIAVIKISASSLPVAVLGDSEKLEVGQWAIAIGNPFGLDRTVTVGIISAKGRTNMGIETYENFIQTDASINPGNSGGPLLNIYGEVVGINTAIVAAGQGIGFAIPVSMAKPVITQLVKNGSVSRGYLGVTIQPLTEELARSFGMAEPKGALVNEVLRGSPADRGGIRQGDIITFFNGKEVNDSSHLQRMVAETPIGARTDLKVFRDGRELTLSVVLASAENAPRKASPGEKRKSSGQADRLGIIAGDGDAEGVVVLAVAPGSIAEEAGIREGDIIVGVNRVQVKNIQEYRRMIGRPGDGALTLLVRRGEANIYFALRLK